MAYDVQEKAYRLWVFDSRGNFPRGPATGQWNEESETMTFAMDFGNGVTGTMKLHFVSKDANRWTLVAKDQDGKVLLDMEGKTTRKK